MLDTRPHIASIQQELRERGASAYLTFDPDNQTYLTGFRALLYSRPIALVVGIDRTTLIVPELELEHATRAAGVDEVRSYSERPDGSPPTDPFGHLDQVLDALADHGPSAVDMEHLPAGIAERIVGQGRKLVPFDDVLRAHRTIKTPAELKMMRLAGAIVQGAVAASLEVCRVGASELEMDAAGDSEIQRQAGEADADATIGGFVMTPSGPHRTILPHTFSTGRRLVAGDVLIHTRQVAFNGYRSELERTAVVGPPTKKQAEAFSAMQAAQAAAMEALKAGVSAAAVDRAARTVIEDAGFGSYAIHRTGHGLGIGAHEHPHIRFDNTEPLHPGTVVTIEPGFYVPGLGGFRHSDTLVVTDAGADLLTEFPGTLAEMTIRG